MLQIRLPESHAAESLAELIDCQLNAKAPYMLALDGPSGAGKSTLATKLRVLLGAVVVDGDSFFAGGVAVRDDPPQARAEACIDFRRQRLVLEALLEWRSARYRGFDWGAFDGRLEEADTLIEPESIVVLEGVYSGRPELADLFDLRVLLNTPKAVRRQRLLAREGALTPWECQWLEAEDWYFANVAPVKGFDVLVA